MPDCAVFGPGDRHNCIVRSATHCATSASSCALQAMFINPKGRFVAYSIEASNNLVKIELSPRSPPKMGGVHHLRGDGHEAEPVHGRTDHRDFAEAGGWGEDGRRVPHCPWNLAFVAILTGDVDLN